MHVYLVLCACLTRLDYIFSQGQYSSKKGSKRSDQQANIIGAYTMTVVIRSAVTCRDSSFAIVC